jgi:hypothetical protein
MNLQDFSLGVRFCTNRALTPWSDGNAWRRFVTHYSAISAALVFLNLCPIIRHYRTYGRPLGNPGKFSRFIAGQTSEASDFPGPSAVKVQPKSADRGLLWGGRRRGELSEIRRKFEKFWRAIVRLVEHNRETGRIGIDETQVGIVAAGAPRAPASESIGAPAQVQAAREPWTASRSDLILGR